MRGRHPLDAATQATDTMSFRDILISVGILSVDKPPVSAALVVRPPTTLADANVTFEVKREDVPSFKVVYECGTVGRGVDLKISARTTSYRDRVYGGELSQGWGKYVWFDAANPADKILDREILPEVQRLCALVIERDSAWIANGPKSFTDEGGTVWTRQ
jgi:hypothetical protein